MASERTIAQRELALSYLGVAALTGSIGYVIATGVVQYWFGHAEPDFLWIPRNYTALREQYPDRWMILHFIVGGSAVGGAMAATRIISEKLTKFGTTHFQTRKELKRNKFFGDARTGFVLAKTAAPKKKGQYIISGKFPHVLLVAPTGSGKGVGFVIPNLLTFKGSAVILDVKGENYEKTARARVEMGQTVYRFSPRDFDAPSFRYNPLSRIAKFTNPAQRMAELERVATLFLQTEDSAAAGFLPNSREVFVACGILAYEQGNLTLGRIHKLAFGGGNEPAARFAVFAKEVKDRSAKLLFEKLAGTTERTLSSYLSVLSSAGLGTWANPHTCAVTDHSDFDFTTFRSRPQTVYLTTPFNEIPAIAPLIRLFFSDLIAALQHHEPDPKKEPFPVLILMDEFQRIGRVPIVAESISLLRSYGGNLAIVTQSIPDLDVVYGDQVRKTIQAGAGIKLYLTPSDPDTIGEMSEAVGMTTKRVVSKSRSVKEGAFSTNVTERTEDHPLLTRDQARRLPEDEVIIVVDAGMPIRAKRLRYFEDRDYAPLFNEQDFSKPLPAPPHTITEADYTYLETAEDREAKAAANREAIEAHKAAAAAKRDAEATPTKPASTEPKPVAQGQDVKQPTLDFEKTSKPIEGEGGQNEFDLGDKTEPPAPKPKIKRTAKSPKSIDGADVLRERRVPSKDQADTLRPSLPKPAEPSRVVEEPSGVAVKDASQSIAVLAASAKAALADAAKAKAEAAQRKRA